MKNKPTNYFDLPLSERKRIVKVASVGMAVEKQKVLLKAKIMEWIEGKFTCYFDDGGFIDGQNKILSDLKEFIKGL